MTTSQELEAITDEGKFERLSISVLRKANPDYANIVHTGVNAAGKTRKCPLDGLGQIPGSKPPHFLMVQCTTTTTQKELEKKWLRDHTTVKIRKPLSKRKTSLPSERDDGDLIKAGREAEKFRKDFPDAKFTVILATNLNLSEVELIRKVWKKAEELRIEKVDLWEQSKLAGFLDTNAEGQYLRKKYLGIETELLSESLLGELCQRSLELYKKELLVTDFNTLVLREITNHIEEGIHNYIYSIQFLIGNSGFGKTVLAYQTLQKHLTSDEYGIWLPAESIKDCINIENALDKVLRDLYPSLCPDAGRIALQLIRQKFQRQNSRFLLIVDDVNRVDSPEKLLNKLSNWAKPIQSNTSHSQPLSSPFLIICPVWPYIWKLVNVNLDEVPYYIHAVSIETMTLQEARKALQKSVASAGKTITAVEADIIVKKLGRDPILIGLFNDLYLSQDHVAPEHIIEQFITRKISELARSSKGSYVDSEYQEALSSLAFRMLQHRTLNPSWNEVRKWVRKSQDELNALKELAKQEQLCRLTRVSDQERFEFRHDRLRDALLIKSMVKILEDPKSKSDILWEPFYVEIIGQALLRAPQNRELLQQMRDKLPLALFEAMRHFGNSTSDYHRQIIDELKEWANNYVKTGTVPDSVLNEVCWSLLETNSPAVLEIPEVFPKHWPVLLARLRNGCARSGALYCGDSELGRNNPLRDRIIEHAKERHGKQLIQQLRQILTSSTISDKERKGALYLIGWFKEVDFQDEIAVCWECAVDKTNILAEAICAAAKCYRKTGFHKLLDPMVSYWADVLDEVSILNPDGSRCDFLAWTLHLGLQDIKSEVVEYFITQSTVHKSLRRSIACICDFINTADALELSIREGASSARKLPSTLLSFVKTLWEDPKNEDFVRDRAFRLWLANIDQEQVEILRAIPASSPLFYRAFSARIHLSDYNVVSELRSLLVKDYRLLYETYHVWCGEIKTILQDHLKSLKEYIPQNFSGGKGDHYFFLARLLTMIPKEDAEILLDKNWEHLGYSCLFIQTALYVGTPKCLELADRSIKQCPQNVPLFKYLRSILGYKETERHEYLTVEHIKRLLPYLDRIEEKELSYLADICQYLNIAEWSQQHLAPRLSEESRKRYHPTDDDLLQQLDEFVADEDYKWRVKYWLEDFDKRIDSEDRALRIVEQWFASNRTMKGLQIVTACLQNIGIRQDLSLLNKYPIKGDSKEIAKIKKSTEFAVHRRSLE